VAGIFNFCIIIFQTLDIAYPNHKSLVWLCCDLILFATFVALPYHCMQLVNDSHSVSGQYI